MKTPSQAPSVPELCKRAAGIFDDSQSVLSWLSSPLAKLDNQATNEVLETETDRQAVYEALVSLEFGVYS